MELVGKIAQAINDHLKQSAFKEEQFASVLLNGVCEPVEKTDSDGSSIAPAIVNRDGEALTIFYDDTRTLSIFHKILNVTNEPGRSTGRTQLVKRTIQCSMILVANRENIRLTQEELDLLILSKFPSALPDIRKALTLKSLIIQVSSSDYNSRAIFQREWVGYEKPMSTGFYLLEVKYTIGCEMDQSCINQCCS